MGLRAPLNILHGPRGPWIVFLHPWTETHRKVREAQGISENAPLWSEGKTLQGISTPRALDLVNLAFQCTKRRRGDLSDDAIEASLFVDVSQSAQRHPWVCGGPLRTTNTSTLLFSYSRRRLLSGAEHLALLGFAHPITSNLTSTQLHSLAGEAMSVPQIGACLAEKSQQPRTCNSFREWSKRPPKLGVCKGGLGTGLHGLWRVDYEEGCCSPVIVSPRLWEARGYTVARHGMLLCGTSPSESSLWYVYPACACLSSMWHELLRVSPKNVRTVARWPNTRLVAACSQAASTGVLGQACWCFLVCQSASKAICGMWAKGVCALEPLKCYWGWCLWKKEGRAGLDKSTQQVGPSLCYEVLTSCKSCELA